MHLRQILHRGQVDQTWKKSGPVQDLSLFDCKKLNAQALVVVHCSVE